MHRKKRIKAECGATARLRELREERMHEHNGLHSGRTFNDPEVRNGMRLVFISCFAFWLIIFALIYYYAA